MIQEYAVGSERYELGCVKGLIDVGESPLQAANRELQKKLAWARVILCHCVFYTVRLVICLVRCMCLLHGICIHQN